MPLIVFAAVLAAACATSGVLAIGACIGATRKHRAGGHAAPGDGKIPAPGRTGPPRPTAAHPPARPAPAPGPWRDHFCGCAIRRHPTEILTCPQHAAHREDILDLLMWADELKDRL